MKRSIFFYFFTLSISVILAVFGIFSINTHSSVYDGTAISSSISTISLANVNESTLEIAENYARTPVFSTANVVKTAVTTFTAPVIEVKDNNYNNGSYNDIYAIMHNVTYGGRFYYAHNTKGFENLKDLSIGDTFYMGGTKYIVKKTELLSYETTKTDLLRIMYADNYRYQISLMTCFGSIGYYQNNSGRIDYTASHRLIVYADQA